MTGLGEKTAIVHVGLAARMPLYSIAAAAVLVLAAVAGRRWTMAR